MLPAIILPLPLPLRRPTDPPFSREELLALAALLPAVDRQRLALALLAELLQAAPDAAEAWSQPDSVRGWAKRFGVSRATMRRRLLDGSLRARPFGRLWQIPASLVPAKRPRPAV
jgi:hypothetical protein